MKKIICLIVSILMMISLIPAVFANDSINVTVDGEHVEFDVKPQIVNGRVVVPMRAIFEKLGATVEWDANTGTASAQKGNTVVKVQVDHMDMYINNQVQWMDVPAYVAGGRMLVPARYVAYALGADVKWDQENNTVVINSRGVLGGKIIVVDAGHGIHSYSKKEAVAPNSTIMKAAFVSGTSGAYQTEEQLNLAVAFKLKEKLEEKGAIVYMTRTEHKADISNIDRAVFANNLNADISIKIHADGNDNKNVRGVTVLVPGNQYIMDDTLIKKSRLAGEFVLECFVKETGAKNRGVSVRNDLTGFNWSKVPVVLVELGFMSNPEEDRLMATEDYQNKMVKGMVDGLEKYFAN